MNGYSVFRHSTFRFHGVTSSGGEVVATLSEKDAGCFGQRVTYSKGEAFLADFADRCREAMKDPEPGNASQNLAEFEKALAAMRARKA
jgi:hypothetical protein